MGKDRVFWELKKTRDGYSKHIGRFFNERYLKKLGIHVPRRKVFHSFRHTVDGLLQYKGVRKELIEGFMGHSHGSMSLTDIETDFLRSLMERVYAEDFL